MRHPSVWNVTIDLEGLTWGDVRRAVFACPLPDDDAVWFHYDDEGHPEQIIFPVEPRQVVETIAP